MTEEGVVPVVSALDFLKNPSKVAIPAVCVITGDEFFFRQEAFNTLRSVVLSDQDAEFCLSRFEGNEVSFSDVLRETAMIALFGSGKRLVVVDQADPFISQNREKLDEYIQNPNKAGILLLQPLSFPSNLKLYKRVGELGLIIECKGLPPRSLPSWLVEWEWEHSKIQLSRESAEVLAGLVGNDPGLLDQEVRRLALLTPNNKIDVNLIKENVGYWKQEKVWNLIDVALEGKTSEALQQLDKLLLAGESPIGILAQLGFTLRKLSAVYQILLNLEETPDAPKPGINTILDQAGVSSFFQAKTQGQLKRLGVNRGRRLIQRLLETDLDLKGASRSDPRLILEKFIVQISHPQIR